MMLLVLHVTAGVILAGILFGILYFGGLAFIEGVNAGDMTKARVAQTVMVLSGLAMVGVVIAAFIW